LTTSTENLLRELVSAFGDAEAVCAVLAEDAEWWITPTVGVLGSPSRGRDSIAAAMEVIFGQLYKDVRTQIRHLISDGDIGSARFTMHATASYAGDKPYENEYCVWIRQRDGAIDRVWEYLDVAHASQQLGF
jgi:uncharacterized protein (TIGR02246 family)